MKLTGQRFGATHLIDILRGSESEKVTRFGHDRLEVYTTGQEFSARQWQSVARQLIQKGFILQDHEAYGALKFTTKGIRLLKGEEAALGFFPEDRERSKAAAKKEAVSESYDEELFQVLRKRRKELADKAGVPPYVVFSDKSLADMAGRMPKTREAFSAVYGVGAKKLETYADEFISLIASYRK
jgi:ATP-dependent DNA helicase RecQ